MSTQKNPEITFLCTYYAQPDLLRICLDSIKKFHPDSRIVVSQQADDDPIELTGVDLIYHNMKEVPWAGAAVGLLKECKTDIGVFIEHDAFLLKSVDEEVAKIASGEFDMIGPEEVNDIRSSPGFICQNFFIINVKKMKEIGLEKVWVYDIPKLKELQAAGKIQNIESGYGMNQSLEKKRFLVTRNSGYAYGMYYGDIVHHLWFGSYKRRNVEYDNVNRLWLEEGVGRLIKDYWNDEIRDSNDSI